MAFVGTGAVLKSRVVGRRSGRMCMSHTPTKEGPDSYVCLGVAVCFKAQGRDLEEVKVVEPLGAATLENISTLEVPTSYMRVTAMKLGDIPSALESLPADFRKDDDLLWGDNFQERADAAARTYIRRETAKLVDLGTIKDDFFFSTERKRILNEKWEPDFNDNVKQDKSIDVYNREADELANA